MDLVDEEHVARLEIREQRREIAGPFDRRTARRAELAPSSTATIRASEVLPRPGGPWKST